MLREPGRRCCLRRCRHGCSCRCGSYGVHRVDAGWQMRHRPRLRARGSMCDELVHRRPDVLRSRRGRRITREHRRGCHQRRGRVCRIGRCLLDGRADALHRRQTRRLQPIDRQRWRRRVGVGCRRQPLSSSAVDATTAPANVVLTDLMVSPIPGCVCRCAPAVTAGRTAASSAARRRRSAPQPERREQVPSRPVRWPPVRPLKSLPARDLPTAFLGASRTRGRWATMASKSGGAAAGAAGVVTGLGNAAGG